MGNSFDQLPAFSHKSIEGGIHLGGILKKIFYDLGIQLYFYSTIIRPCLKAHNSAITLVANTMAPCLHAWQNSTVAPYSGEPAP